MSKWPQDVIATAKAAAVAVALFWDALRRVEGQTNMEFDGSMDVVEELAADCHCPASVNDLDSENVVVVLDRMLEQEER